MSRYKTIVYIKSFFVAIQLLAFSIIVKSQNKPTFTISGFITDSASSETMPLTTVAIKALNLAVLSNNYGYYAIKVPTGNWELTATFIGYNSKSIAVSVQSNLTLNIELSARAKFLKQVEIQARKADNNITDPTMGKVEVNVEKIKALPALLGEVDILKTIQLLPGVRGAGEGNSGFYVRGGGPDQNLILLDEAAVYNASHLFGFFSVFNADAINNVSLIKGGMPAQYGGRISSVLNINMKEGNAKKFRIEGGLGLIASRLTLQGPVVKDKSSFIISARRTYIDLLTDPFIPKTASIKGSGYYFYDLNAKFNHKFSNKDRIFFSGYFGRDVFNFISRNNGFGLKIPWGNATATFRWNHLFSNKLFMNTTLIYSDFNFETEAMQQQFKFKLNSGIKDLSLKSDLDYYVGNGHNVKFGGLITRHQFFPSAATANFNNQIFEGRNIKQFNAYEWALYFNDVWDLNEKLQANLGLRFSGYSQVGPYIYNIYNTQRSDVTRYLVRSDTFNQGQNIVNYKGLEPRFSFRYLLPKNASIKASINRNLQYIHLASSSGSALPTDIWVPSTKKVRPQVGWQYALGYFKNFPKSSLETSVELYYKKMHNQIDFRNGAVQEFDQNLEDDFVFGKGWSYGSEWFIKKSTGKFTGWIGYTLSWTFRQFDDINYGKKFYFKYDRRHDLSVVSSYEHNKNWTFSATFVYGTGNLTTLPQSIYYLEGNVNFEIQARNNYRMIPYHRLDLAAVFSPSKNKNNKYNNNWTFAIYNVYSRLNPYFVYLDTSGALAQGSLKVNAKQVSLFPIIPSITWNFNF